MREFTVAVGPLGEPVVSVDGVPQDGVVRAVPDVAVGREPTLHLTYRAGFHFEGAGEVVVTDPSMTALVAFLGRLSAGELEKAALAHQGPGVSPGAGFLAGLRDLAAKALADGA